MAPACRHGRFYVQNGRFDVDLRCFTSFSGHFWHPGPPFRLSTLNMSGLRIPFGPFRLPVRVRKWATFASQDRIQVALRAGSEEPESSIKQPETGSRKGPKKRAESDFWAGPPPSGQLTGLWAFTLTDGSRVKTCFFVPELLIPLSTTPASVGETESDFLSPLIRRSPCGSARVYTRTARTGGHAEMCEKEMKHLLWQHGAWNTTFACAGEALLRI